MPKALLPALALSFFAAVVVADEKGKSDEAAKEKMRADIKALEPMHPYVGRWRGFSRPGRGSDELGFAVDSQWEYDFDAGRVALIFEATDAKFFVDGRILATKEPGVYEFTGVVVDSKEDRKFKGRVDDEKLVLEAVKVVDNEPARITIKIVARGDRMVINYERFSSKTKRYYEMAEVGYTRKGSGYGGTGGSRNECVVTGGYSSSSVTYNGQSYFICCSGCRDMFMKDPEAALAEYKLRKEREKKEREKRDNK